MFLHHFDLMPVVLLVLLTYWRSMVSASHGRHKRNSQLRIIGGSASRPGVWPFMAAIFRVDHNEMQQKCAGVVWNHDTILTAGHCLEWNARGRQDDLAIYLGHSDISQLNSNYLFSALNCKYAPGYFQLIAMLYDAREEDIISNDLALIRLNRRIDFEGRHSSVCCVGYPEPLHLLDTTKCITMGWGHTSPKYKNESVVDPHSRGSSILMEVDMIVRSEKYCARASQGYFEYNSSMHLCVTHPKSGNTRGPGHGDSGGPLVCPLRRDPTRYSLVGITVAVPIIPGISKSPFFYTKVFGYLGWIEDKLAHWDPEPENWWHSINWGRVVDIVVLIVFVAVAGVCLCACLCRCLRQFNIV